jgi:hypothetical protein
LFEHVFRRQKRISVIRQTESGMAQIERAGRYM